MSIKLLIAEDTSDVAEVVAFGARMNWPDCQVTIAENGEVALQCFAQDPPDLVVLDIAMPKVDGFDVCRRIRQVSQVPILMLTVRGATVDKVRAFDLGADQYLTKPFDHIELLARLRSLARRRDEPGETDARFVCGDLSIGFAIHEVCVRGEIVHLTSTEYRLLETLAQHAGTILPHALLLERVWGPAYTHDKHYLKVFVQRLRHKLGDDSENPHYIQTEWGVGYRFVSPAAAG